MIPVKDKKWELVSSKPLINRPPWMVLRCDTFRLPNGRVVPEYYILDYPDWVNVIAITTKGEFVMISQYRPALARTSYELCAGVCDSSDSSPEESARRELLEESGYGGGEWQKIMEISANPATQTNLTHCFLARGVEKLSTQNLDESEDIDIHLFSESQLRELLLSGDMYQALQIAPLWKYFAQYCVNEKSFITL